MNAWLHARTLGAALAAAAVLALVLLRPWDRSEGEPAAEIPLETLYARMVTALTPREGNVVHMRSVSLYESGEYRREATMQTWFDVPNERLRVREEVPPRSPPLEPLPDRIRQGGTTYYLSPQDDMPMKFEEARCVPAPPFPLPEFVDCEQGTADFDVTVVRGRSPDGRDALAIKTTGKRGGIDSVVTYTRRLFIDPVTYLPLAVTQRSSDRYAIDRYTQKSTSTQTFTFDFVAASSLGADFFDPTSIGYVEEAGVP